MTRIALVGNRKVFWKSAQPGLRSAVLAAPISQLAEEHSGPVGSSGPRLFSTPVKRRAFLQGAVGGAAALAWPHWAQADTGDLGEVLAQIEKRHDEAVHRLQEWIRQPSI